VFFNQFHGIADFGFQFQPPTSNTKKLQGIHIVFDVVIYG
ncbi:hypothetical protein AALP_AAs60939U000100, partial [Arabis alpina]